MSSVFVDQQRHRIRVQMRGDWGGGELRGLMFPLDRTELDSYFSCSPPIRLIKIMLGCVSIRLIKKCQDAHVQLLRRGLDFKIGNGCHLSTSDISDQEKYNIYIRAQILTSSHGSQSQSMPHKTSILRHKVSSHPFPYLFSSSSFSYWLFHFFVFGVESWTSELSYEIR